VALAACCGALLLAASAWAQAAGASGNGSAAPSLASRSSANPSQLALADTSWPLASESQDDGRILAFAQIDDQPTSDAGGVSVATQVSPSALTVTGTNTYSGDTHVQGGVLAGNIPPGTNLTIETGATYDGGGAARSVSALNGSGRVINTNGLTVQSGAFSGQISGNGGLTKTGPGTLWLGGGPSRSPDSERDAIQLQRTTNMEAGSGQPLIRATPVQRHVCRPHPRPRPRPRTGTPSNAGAATGAASSAAKATGASGAASGAAGAISGVDCPATPPASAASK